MELMPPEKFWALEHAYDAAIFPIQYLFSVIAIVLLILIAKKPSQKLNVFTNLFLMACYIFIGTAFFLVHNREMAAQMRYFQPILMFIIALLFGLDVFIKKTHYRYTETAAVRWFSWFFAAFAIIGYPIAGWLLSHPYIVSNFPIPILGCYPCPTTMFALALLSASLPKANKVVVIFLLFWALSSPNGPAVRVYGVYEDWVLFLSGVFALIMLILRFRQKPPK